MPEITLDQQLICAQRELRMRTTCYPRWVQDGRMLQHTADHEIAAMQAIVKTLESLVDAQIYPQPSQLSMLPLVGEEG